MLTIRTATPADQDALVALTIDAYSVYAAMIPPEFWAGYRENILETLGHDGNFTRIVAERDGELVGSVLYRSSADEEPDAAMIRLLAVAPTAQGQGVGRRLMEECLARARQEGAAAMILHTTDMMQAAMALYAQLGFVRAPELDFKPFPPEMETQLDATLRDARVKGFRLALR